MADNDRFISFYLVCKHKLVGRLKAKDQINRTERLSHTSLFILCLYLFVSITANDFIHCRYKELQFRLH